MDEIPGWVASLIGRLTLQNEAQARHIDALTAELVELRPPEAEPANNGHHAEVNA